MNRLKLSCALILAVFWLGTSVLTAERPNVILIVTDDQGYGDFSCHGNPRLQTPELDRLYAESVRLTDYHVSPTCAPTRASLMTGRYANRTGVWHTINGRSILRQGETTLAEILRDAGWRTGIFGKWHLGDNYPSRPQDRGFEEVFIHSGGGIGQTPDVWDNGYFDGTYLHNGTRTKTKGFCTDVLFNRAMDFADKHKDEPFFIYLATNAAHAPMHAPAEFSEPYAGLGVRVANFYGMIANIDWNMGRLIRFLKRSGLDDNTVLIFSADNGSAAGWKLYNSGMRAGKGSEYDGGHRVPCFVRWPNGRIEGGRDVDALSAHIDWLPTIAELCDVNVPNSLELDGISLETLLRWGLIWLVCHHL